MDADRKLEDWNKFFWQLKRYINWRYPEIEADEVISWCYIKFTEGKYYRYSKGRFVTSKFSHFVKKFHEQTVQRKVAREKARMVPVSGELIDKMRSADNEPYGEFKYDLKNYDDSYYEEKLKNSPMGLAIIRGVVEGKSLIMIAEEQGVEMQAVENAYRRLLEKL